jgi:hypothetical protein
MQPDDYTDHLADLAIGLNSDNQYQEALGVVDRCLQINAAHLECLFLKSDALFHLGHLVEAKSLIKTSLVVGAISEVDAAAKRALQNLLTQVNMALDTRTAERTPNTPNQTGTTLQKEHRTLQIKRALRHAKLIAANLRRSLEVFHAVVTQSAFR